MKRVTTPVALGALLLGMLLLQSGYSEDKPAAEKKGQNSAASTEKKTRLPNYYGKLNLTADQRSKAITIREKFGKQIDELRAQIEKLQNEQSEELNTILTDDQKVMLARLEKEAKERRAARAAANVKAAANGSDKKEKEE